MSPVVPVVKTGFASLRNIRGRLRRALRVVGLAAAASAALTVAGAGAMARAPDGVAPGTTITASALPSEAQQTQQLIIRGGPFPYSKDGTVFVNRERLLPNKPRGWYREYTVKTPGSRNRGARRIVCGGEPPTAPQACYYTDDHYASFRRIVQ